MKMEIFTLLIVSLLSSAVNATTFEVSNFNVSDRYGNTEQFKWKAKANDGAELINLTSVNDTQAFTYGIFSTLDFDLNNRDVNDDNDFFKSKVFLDAPGVFVSDYGSPDAQYNNLGDFVIVEFDNTFQKFAFGNGGIIGLRFLDTDTLLSDGSVELRAELRLFQAETVAAVPVPSAVFLMGSGLIGLVAARRKANA